MPTNKIFEFTFRQTEDLPKSYHVLNTEVREQIVLVCGLRSSRVLVLLNSIPSFTKKTAHKNLLNKTFCQLAKKSELFWNFVLSLPHMQPESWQGIQKWIDQCPLKATITKRPQVCGVGTVKKIEKQNPEGQRNFSTYLKYWWWKRTFAHGINWRKS